MDWPTFAVEMTKALAWPVASIVALVMLRKPILGLIPLARKLKYKDFEMEFGAQIREVQAEAAAELPPSTVPTLLAGVPDTIRELARISPRSAVLEAWRDVEAAVEGAADRVQVTSAGTSYRPQRGATQLIRDLTKSRVVDGGMVSLYHDLRSLRNQAAHAPEFALSTDAAIEYAQVARRLAEYFKQLSAQDSHLPA